MSKDDLIDMDGVVLEVLAGGNFKVAVKNSDGTLGHTVLCYLGGKVRKNNVRVGLQDAVVISVSPYDPTRGKITYRYK